MKRALTLAVALATFVPPAAAIFYVHLYGVNAAHWDHLTNAELFDRYYGGTLSAEFLLQPHLEHIKLFPRLLWLALGTQSRFNNVVEMLTQCALVCGSAAILLIASRRETGATWLGALASFFPVSLLLFTPRQHEALLVGDGTIAYLCVLAGMATIALLRRGETPATVAAAATAFVASFSHANGLLFWPLGLVLIGARGLTLSRVLVWAAGFATTAVLYATHWPRTAGASIGFALAHPVRTAAFALGAAGTPFAQAPVLQIAIGTAAVAIQLAALFLVWRSWKQGLDLPAGSALILFALGGQALIATGRTAEDVGVGVASRYAVFMSLGIAGAYLSALALVPRDAASRARRIAQLSMLLIFGGSVSGYAEGWRAGPTERDGRLRAAQVLRTASLQTDQTLAELLFPSAPDARRYAAMLEHWKLNVFGEPACGPLNVREGRVPARHFLDQLNFRAEATEAVVRSRESISITGWTFDQQTWGPFACGYVRLDTSGRRIPIAYGLNRPDVSGFHHLRRGSGVGYTVVFSADALAPGKNSISLELVARTGDRIVTVPSIVTITRQ